MEHLEKSEKLTALRKAIDTTIDQKEKIKLIQETAKILQEVNAEKTKHLDQTITLGHQQVSKELIEVNKQLSTKDKKEFITTEEFTKLYNIGEDTQKELRNRLKHPLPYIQIKKRGNIQYNTKKVELWLENYQNNY